MALAATAAPPSSAKDPSVALANALNAGDLECAVAGFVRDAALITPGASTIRGCDNIRAILFQLIAMRPTVEIEQLGLLVAGDAAIATEKWTIRLDGLELTPFAQMSESTAVLRRIEGAWKLQIAAPWGWG
jgi:ketosteroid isomerase-like protein